MNSEMTNIIAELNRANSLYDNLQELHRELDHLPTAKSVEEDEIYEETVLKLNEFKSEKDGEFPVKKPLLSPAILTTIPKVPEKPDTKTPEKDIMIGAISALAMLACAAIWLLMIIINPESGFGLILAYFCPVPLLASIAVFFAVGMPKLKKILDWQAKHETWEKDYADWERNFNNAATAEEDERFLNEFKKYDFAFLELVKACDKKYEDEEKRCQKALNANKKKYDQKELEILNSINEVEKDLSQVTVIHSSLFEHAWRISSILSTGRADTLKDAINLALEEDRRDKEEAERRAEAQRQEAILEQQAMDNRMHNAAMERAAEEEARRTRAHNAAMERAAQQQAQAAEAQAREAAKQTEMAKKQANDAMRAASARCSRCANYSKCSYKVKQNAVNCAAYTPR